MIRYQFNLKSYSIHRVYLTMYAVELLKKYGDDMKKILDWLKLIVASCGLVYLILVIIDEGFKPHMNFVLSNVVALYVIIFGIEGMFIKKSKELVYMFYLFIGILIFIFNMKFGF